VFSQHSEAERLNQYLRREASLFPAVRNVKDHRTPCVLLGRTAWYLPVPESLSLKFEAERSIYVIRSNALDRFGTK